MKPNNLEEISHGRGEHLTDKVKLSLYLQVNGE